MTTQTNWMIAAAGTAKKSPDIPLFPFYLSFIVMLCSQFVYRIVSRTFCTIYIKCGIIHKNTGMSVWVSNHAADSFSHGFHDGIPREREAIL